MTTYGTTTYRQRPVDVIKAADGYHAYVDMLYVGSGSTCMDALEAACQWIDRALAEQTTRQRSLLRLVHARRQPIMGGDDV